MKKSCYKIVQWHYRKTKEMPENWDMVALGKLCSVRKEGMVDSDLYVGLENIGQGNNRLENSSNVADFTSTKNIFLKDDILYGKLRPLLNKIWLAEKDGHCSTDILPLVPNDKILGRMLLFVLLNHNFYWYAVGMSAGTKMPRVNWSDIKKFLVALPPKEEQKTIASILSNVDSLIEQTQKKIEQTQRLKKGLMQRLLTKGIGHTKFKEVTFRFHFLRSQIPESWDLLPMTKISQDGLKNGIFKKSEEFGSGTPLVNVTDLFTENEIFLDKLEKVKVNDKELEQFGITEGDIFFCRSSLVMDGIGRSNTVGNLTEPAVFECHVMMLRPNKLINPKFLFYFTRSQIFKKYLYAISMTLTMTTIRQPDLELALIPLPPLPEQQKIASILSNVDSQIQKQQQYKSKLETLKKGLMQKLLTGQIQVKV